MKKMIAGILLVCMTLVIGNAATEKVAPTLTIRKNEQVPNQSIALGAWGQTFGSYLAVVTGGAMLSQSQTFYISAEFGGGVTNTANFVLVNKDGATIAGPVDPKYLFEGNPLGEVGSITFTDTVALPEGTNVLFLKGRAKTSFRVNGRVVTETGPSLWTVTDINGTPLPQTDTTAVIGQTMTVWGPTLKVSFIPSQGAVWVVSGVRGLLFGEYVLDATESSEDIRVTGVPGHYEHDTVHGERATDLTAITHYDGAVQLTTGVNVLNPIKPGGQEITYDGTGLIVPFGTIKTITQKVNIRAGITGSYLWSLPEGYTKQFASHTVGLNSAMTAQVIVQPFTGAYILRVVPHGEVTITREYTPAISESGTGADDFIVLGIKPNYENFQGDLLSILVKVDPTPNFSRGNGLSAPRLVSRDGAVDMTSVLVPLTWQEATFYTATFIIRDVTFPQDIKTELKFKMGYDNALDTGHEVRSWLLGEPKFIGTTSGARVTQSLPNESDGQTVVIRRVPQGACGDANQDGKIDRADLDLLIRVLTPVTNPNEAGVAFTERALPFVDTFPDGKFDEWDVAALDAYLKGLFLTLPVGDVNYDWKLTTLDIAWTRQGILGLRFLRNFQVRQADINENGGVTTLDISLMRRLILGLGIGR